MWTVYVLLCEDVSYYIGVTNNLERRFKEHIASKGAKYTRSHKPVKIAYQETFSTKSEALQREFQLKKFSHQQKSIIIKK